MEKENKVFTVKKLRKALETNSEEAKSTINDDDPFSINWTL